MTTDTRVEYVQGQHPDEWSDAEFDAKLRNFKAQLQDISAMGAGAKWYIPPEWRGKLKDLHFIRLGTMADLARQATILARKAVLEEQGWKPAPKGVLCLQTPTDRDQGVYMCLPTQRLHQWRALISELEQMRRQTFKARRLADIADQLENGPGPKIHIDRFEPTQVTTTVGDLIGEQLDKSKRRK